MCKLLKTNRTIFYEIIHTINKKCYKPGDVILDKDQKIDKVIIIIRGNVAVSDIIDADEFVIDIISQGCLINHNNFFADDISRVKL